MEQRNSKEWYISNFAAFERKLNGGSKTFLHEIRKAAMQDLTELNFPTQHNEDWKYTDISPIVNNDFVPALILVRPKLKSTDIEKYIFKNFECHIIVFINGIFSEELSEIKELPRGALIGSLKKLYKEKPQLVDLHFNKISKNENAFGALNTAYASDGFAAIIPDGMIVEKPVQILYLNSSETGRLLSVPRNFLMIGKNSRLSVISNYRGCGSEKYFSNIVTEILIDENGILDFYKVQYENDDAYHIEKVQAIQKKNSVFNHYNINFGGAIVRNDINSLLDDENIETHFYGLYLAHGKQHIDNHTFADHVRPNCMSNELYKGILDDSAHGVFNGKIIVRKNAQKTNAYQSNKTILLSRTARIDTKPQLEIFADDVKCSHGATVGQLDEEAEFYIRSRGVPQELAKSMLIRAFANDVIGKVKIEPLKEQINHMIFKHLHRVEIESK